MTKFHRPSAATVLSGAALFMAMGGGAYAAQSSISGHDLTNNSVTHNKLAGNAVWHSNLGSKVVQMGNLNQDLQNRLNRVGSPGGTGAAGPAGPAGPKGATGAQGPAGTDGANPATKVTNVPAITSGSGNPNPDSGAAGDAGFYFTGNGAGGSASITGGELALTGSGVDSNTFQGGIGVAKAYDSVPLANLDGASYDYHVQTTHGANTPLLHVTVTGLNADSKFASGFANLVYSPALNNGNTTPVVGQSYSADAFLPGAKWYSTTQPNIGDPGGQNDPQPLSFFQGGNPGAKIIQISLDNGGSSGASGDFSAGADDLVIGLSGTNSRYDFGS